MHTATTYTEIVRSGFNPAFVKTVFAILFFKVGIRTGRVWRGIVVIKIGLVNDLNNIIQNHVGMNFLRQIISIYVHKSRALFLLRIISEGSLIYNFRIKIQAIA